ncbi:type IV secretion system protein [Actinotalea subterranea]|uniref:type IV secretion system protein n=1 Tax=Actinotalea subterranea TaxID=2607497 RepID=UPI00165DBE0D|nr:type IV secretion system protein [Actinotalea subterranea]
MLADVDPCVGPIGLVCDLVTNAATAAQGAASDYVLGGLGAAFMGSAASLGDLALAALDATTTVDLSADWFRSNLTLMATITLPVVVALFVAQVISSVLRREPGGLGRAVLGVGKATLGAALAVAGTQLALTAVDGMCHAIAQASGTTVGAAGARFFRFAGLATATSPALQILLGTLLSVGFLLLWGVLLFRKAALVLIAVFAPVAFAGAAWDQTRVWTRRWLEVVAALVFSKLVIVVAFVVGASAFGGAGSTGATGTPAAPGAELSDALVGALLLAIAVFAPWLTWRFVHWSGMEAAGMMHATVAANPISRTAGAAGRTTKIAAQQAVITTVTSGAGSALAGARAARAGGAMAGATGASGSAGPVAGARPGPLPATGRSAPPSGGRR